MTINGKSTKSRILGLASSRRRLNSSKTIDEVTYYSLADVESVVAAVLSEVSSDPTVGITLEAADTGVILNCVAENGDEYAVDVDLESEDAAGDVNSSRRRMSSPRARHMNASKRTTSGKRRLNCSTEYFAVPMSDRRTIAMIGDDALTDYDIYNVISDKGYKIPESEMYKDDDKFYYLTWDTEGEYLEG